MKEIMGIVKLYECEDCNEIKDDVNDIDIEGYNYKLCRECLADRDLNDELDGVYE